MRLAQPRGRKAQPGQRAAPEVLHQHVRIFEVPRQIGLARLGGQIERHGGLAPVEPDEIARLARRHVVVAAREIALGPLDLDHLGPRIGKARGGEGRGHGLFDGHDLEPFERAVRRHQNDLGRPSTCSAT